jgi:hypothetical protein
MIEKMEAQARVQLSKSASVKAQALITDTHQGKIVTVHARLLNNGRSIFGYGFDGVRLERSTLLQLLCTKTECPKCQQTQANWRRFQGIADPVPKKAISVYQFRHLAEEVLLDFENRTIHARPASFQCRTVCPVEVHGHEIVRKTGWDLFEGGAYIGGGLTTNPASKLLEPLLPTIHAAKDWLAQRAPHSYQSV